MTAVRLGIGMGLALCTAIPAAAGSGPVYVPPIVVTAPATLYNAGSGVYPNVGRVAVDKAGNVFLLAHTGSSGTLLEVPFAAPAGTAASTTLITGLGQYNSYAVFVDAAGNLWIANGNGSNGILEIPASASGIPNTSLTPNVAASSITTACTATPTTACFYADNVFATNLTNYYSQPSDIQVVTLAGTTYVYFVDYYDGNSSGKYNRVVRFSTANPGTGTIIADELPSDAYAQIAVDSLGNVFYNDALDSNVGASTGNVYAFGTATGLNGGGSASAGSVAGISAYQVGTNPTIASAKITGVDGISVDRYNDLFLGSLAQISEVPNEGGTLNYADEFGIASLANLNASTFGVTVDQNGNMYYGSYSTVNELEAGGHNFGSVAVGSAPVTGPSLNVYFNVATTIAGNYFPTGSPDSSGSVAYLQSFPYSGTKTCSGSYTAGQQCNVTVNFQPIHPGLLEGSYTPRDSSSNEEVVAKLQGVGVGPEALLPSSSPQTLFTAASTSASVTTPVNLSAPTGIAVDTFGDVFVADTGNSRVVADCLSTTAAATANSFCSSATGYPGAVVALGTAFTAPAGIALDGANNLYVTDKSSNTVTMIQSDNLASSVLVPATATFNGTALSGPTGIVVDGYGNLYIADTANNRIVKAQQFGAAVTMNSVYLSATVPFGGTALNGPTGLALDAAGDLFIADTGNNRVVEYSASGTSSVVSTSVTLSAPVGVAVLPSGTLIITQASGVLVTSSAFPALITSTSFGTIGGVALDLAGNYYLTSSSKNLVTETVTSTGAFAFPQTAQGSTSAAVSSNVLDAGNATLNISAVAFDSGDTNFVLDPANTCAASTMVTAGTSCLASVDFAPKSTGTLTGTLSLTDNQLAYSLNTAGSNETATFASNGALAIGLSGSALASQTISFPAPASPITYGASAITLNATASSGLPITYSVSGPATLSGSTLTFTGAGTVMVTASQAGNSTYAAATPVMQSITVNKATLTYTAVSASRFYDQANPVLTYSVSGFVSPDTAASSVTGAPAISTSATPKSAAASYPITIAAGTLAAANYTFTFVNGSLTVSGGDPQSIFFPPLANFSSGTTVTLVAGSTSGLTVTFAVTTGSGTINGNQLTITAPGPVTVTASQPGNGNFAAATSVARSFTAQ